MLGYGFANSFIQRASLENIISSFLNRIILSMPEYFAALIIIINEKKVKKSNVGEEIYVASPVLYFADKLEDFNNAEDLVEDLFNLFIEDEYYITKYKNKNSNGNENLYKYLLSANVAFNKDYVFQDKTTEECISEGRENLKLIFENVLLLFLNSIKGKLQDLIISVDSNLFLKNKRLKYVPSIADYSMIDKNIIKKQIEIIFNIYIEDIQNVNNFYKFYESAKQFIIRDNYLQVLDRQLENNSRM